MRKCLEIKADGKKYGLRLDVAGQMKLLDKFEEDAIQTVMSAGGDLRRMVALLDAALNWKGNENPITDGAEFLDLLVDEGYAGVDAFGALAVDIAASSGIVNTDQAKKTRDYLGNAVAGTFDSLDAQEENPTHS